MKGTLEVHPIKDFGAIEIGTHQFRHIENGKEEIRIAKEEIAQKEKAALEKQKEAAAVEMKGKLEEAERVQQVLREKAEAEQKQKIEQAIKTGAGNKEETIKQLETI